MKFDNNENLTPVSDKKSVNVNSLKFLENIQAELNQLVSQITALSNVVTGMETVVRTGAINAENINASDTVATKDLSATGNTTLNDVNAHDVGAHDIEATGELKAASAKITGKAKANEIEASVVNAETMNVDNLNFDTFNADNANINDLDAGDINATNVKATKLEGSQGDIDTVNATDVNSTDVTATGKTTTKDLENTGAATLKDVNADKINSDLIHDDILTVKRQRINADENHVAFIPENGYLCIPVVNGGKMSIFVDKTTDNEHVDREIIAGIILDYAIITAGKPSVKVIYAHKDKFFEKFIMDDAGNVYFKRSNSLTDSRRVFYSLEISEANTPLTPYALTTYAVGNEPFADAAFEAELNPDNGLLDFSYSKLIKGHMKIDGNLDVTGTVNFGAGEIDHAKYLGKTEKITGDDEGNFIATENADIGGDLSVGGDAAITGDATIGGDADITGKLDVTGDADIGGDATVAGEMTVTGDLHATADKAKADENGTPFSAFLNKNIGMYYDLVIHDETTLNAFLEAPNDYKNVLFMPSEDAWDLSSIPSTVDVKSNLTGWCGSRLNNGIFYKIPLTTIKIASNAHFSGLISNFYISCDTTLTTSAFFLKNCGSSAFRSFAGMNAEDCDFYYLSLGAVSNLNLSNAVLKNNKFSQITNNGHYVTVNNQNAIITGNKFEFDSGAGTIAYINGTFTEMHDNTFEAYRISLANNTEYLNEKFNIVSGGKITFNSVRLVNCDITGNNENTNIDSYMNDSTPSSSYSIKAGLYNCRIDVGYIFGGHYVGCKVHLKRAENSPILSYVKMYASAIECAPNDGYCPYINDSEFIACRIYTQAGCDDYMIRNCSLVDNEIIAAITKINQGVSNYSGVYINNSTVGKTAHIRGNRFILTYNSNLQNLIPVFKINSAYNVRNNVISIIASNVIVDITAASTLVSCYADCGTTAAGYDSQTSGNNYIERKTA